MTTSVIVKANHGWPVKVTYVDSIFGAPRHPPRVVEQGCEQTFHIHDGADLRVHEIQPEAKTAFPRHEEAEAILQFFAYEHLPEHLKRISAPFGELARAIVEELPHNPERAVFLRKLLEAKDAAVRAKLFV